MAGATPIRTTAKLLEFIGTPAISKLPCDQNRESSGLPPNS